MTAIWQEILWVFEGNRMQLLMQGLLATVQITAGAITIGLILGCIVAYLKMSKIKIFKAIAFVYLGVIRGTPAVIQLIIIAGLMFAGFRGNRIWIGIVGLGINSGAYVAELIRAGIMSIDKGQSEAGASLGFNRLQTMVFIVMPQAIKNILPAFINEFIVLVKETAIVGWVAVSDLTRLADQLMARSFRLTPIYTAAVMYLILISLLTFLLGLVEKRIRASDEKDNEEVAK